MTDARLKSLVERIERLMDERDGLGEDIRDVFTEVKSAGYVPKVLRKVIVRRRMDPSKRAEEDSWQEMYESALDGPTRKALTMAASGATARQIEAETGIDQATVARSVSLKKRRETKPPHDPETGEINKEVDHDAGLVTLPASEVARVAPPTPPANSVESGVANLARDGGAPVETSTVGPAVTTSRIANQIAAVTPLPDDPLDFPPGLDRRHERVRG
jgi:uncharacterized protein (UPF0335 family)